MTGVTRCDQCGRTVAYNDESARSWLRVLGRQRITDYLNGRRPDQEADLCSWACLRDYAAVQQLDPDRT